METHFSQASVRYLFYHSVIIISDWGGNDISSFLKLYECITEKGVPSSSIKLATSKLRVLVTLHATVSHDVTI